MQTLIAPPAGAIVTASGRETARWVWGAMRILSSVAANPDGLAAICERLAQHPQVQLQVSQNPRRLRDAHTPGLSAAEWCLPDTIVLCQMPETEGLGEFARQAGLKRSCFGIPRQALTVAP